MRAAAGGVVTATPHLPERLDLPEQDAALRSLLDELPADHSGSILRWYYTPRMPPFSDHVAGAGTVYDCMVGSPNFQHAPPELAVLERRLLEAADLVFTGGFSLYEVERELHPSVHAFPSSVDAVHFAQARTQMPGCADQDGLPRPRFGF